MIVVADTTPLISYTEVVEAVEILKDSGRHIKKDLYEALLEAAKKFQ